LRGIISSRSGGDCRHRSGGDGTELSVRDKIYQVANLHSFHDPKAGGVCSTEVPHLLKTMAGSEFDQIYYSIFAGLPPMRFGRFRRTHMKVEEL
jgi:hypothetical protein